MKKFFLSMTVVAIVAAGIGAHKAYKYYQPKNDLLAMNLEALAEGEDMASETGSITYQVVEATRTETTTTEPGWTWDVSLKIWLFNGKATKKTPTNVTVITIKYNCCIEKGTETCVYILCSENPLA